MILFNFYNIITINDNFGISQEFKLLNDPVKIQEEIDEINECEKRNEADSEMMKKRKFVISLYYVVLLNVLSSYIITYLNAFS